jgi:hypothetical protein
MISMTTEQLEKIELLDKLFGAMGVAELKQYVESEQIISKLKGTNPNPNPNILYRLMQGHDIQSVDMMNLKGQLDALKYEFQQLLRVMNKPFDSYAITEFNNLKSRHNVY